MYFSDVRGDKLRQPAPVMAVCVTMFAALVAEFIPWPAAMLALKPTFPVLALVYWAVHRPLYVNYGAAVAVGVFLDLANQAPLGFHAASCVVVVLLTNVFAHRFLLLAGVAQALHVLFALVAGQLTLFALGHLEARAGAAAWSWRLLLPSFSASLLWLLLPIALRHFRLFAFGRGRHARF